MFNVSKELESLGHKIMPFSINYTRNLPTPYSKYFVEPLGSRDEVYFNDQKLGAKSLFTTLERLFYSREVEKAVSRMIEDTKPHVAYILHFLRKLSPSVLVGIKRHKIPIIVRLSDFGMVCPGVHCLYKSNPCTLCVKGNILPSLRFKCIKGSVLASALNVLATFYHRRKGYFDLIDCFVVTNKFMYSIMMKAGYPKERLAMIPTFTNTAMFTPGKDSRKESYIVYSGRLEEIKGVHILIDAFAKLIHHHDVRLKIAGQGTGEYTDFLKEKVNTLCLDNKVEFLGDQDSSQLTKILAQAQFSVVPSICYENLPNAVIESFASGTPVIASDLGCLPDIIHPMYTGELFRAGDAENLAMKMALLLDNPSHLHVMATNAREEALQSYTPKLHVDKLLSLFNRFITVS
jgi:glycosyltransferase involved in cell wall biosynthesis